MPRLDPPMKWSWVEPSSCRGTHPQPPRAKPFTGFVPRAPSCAQEARRRRVVVGWDTLVALWWVARDMFRPERRQAAPRPWQGAAVGRFGSNAPPRRFAWDTLVAVWWVARSHRREGRPWWAAPRAWWRFWGDRLALLGRSHWSFIKKDDERYRLWCYFGKLRLAVTDKDVLGLASVLSRGIRDHPWRSLADDPGGGWPV